jgi:hypothetical protein
MTDSAETERWLVDPKVTRPAYWIVHAMGILQFMAAGALLIYGVSMAEWVFAGVISLSATLFLVVAGLLGAQKGGVMVMGRGGAVRIFGRSATDFLEIPAGEIAGLRVIRRREFWGREAEPNFVCSVELARTSGTTLLLLELSNMEAAEDVALTFREVTGWDILTEPAVAEGQMAAPKTTGISVLERSGDVEVTFRPGGRYALSAVTLALSIFSVVTGVLLLLAVESTGVAGFLFGPFLGALGVCCLLLWLFHALGGQRLDLKGGRAWVYFYLGGWRLGRTDVDWSVAESRTRLRTRGAMGFALELVSAGRIVSLAPGCTRGAAVEPAALVALGDHLLARRSQASNDTTAKVSS